MIQKKKAISKQPKHTKRGLKLDRSKVAAHQPSEVHKVRVNFYKMKNGDPIHPRTIDLKNYCALFNNSRRKIYEHLEILGWIRAKK